MPFARNARQSAPASRSGTGGFRRGKPLRPRFDIRLIADLLTLESGYAAYAGIGSRETPDDVLLDMIQIAEALEARGFTLRSGFAGGADTAFELGTSRDDLREIFAPWRGFGANPNSKWEKPRWDLIRAWEARTGRRFTPAKAHLLSGPYAAKAEALAAEHHPAWDRLSQAAQKLHSRNMGQVLGPCLDTPARFLIAWTSDGQDTGGTGQAIRIADSLGIPVLNLFDTDVRAEILRVLGLSSSSTATAEPVATAAGGSVRYVSGDITLDDADLLVNTVNVATARMGKGVALAFRTRWPSIMPAYESACRRRELRAGGCRLFDLPDGRKWAGLATKHHWSDDSRIEWIRSGLTELATLAREAGIRSIAIPPPGCGNGGLDWADVEPLVLEALGGFDLHIYARSTMGVR